MVAGSSGVLWLVDVSLQSPPPSSHGVLPVHLWSKFPSSHKITNHRVINHPNPEWPWLHLPSSYFTKSHSQVPGVWTYLFEGHEVMHSSHHLALPTWREQDRQSLKVRHIPLHSILGIQSILSLFSFFNWAGRKWSQLHQNLGVLGEQQFFKLYLFPWLAFHYDNFQTRRKVRSVRWTLLYPPPRICLE